MSEIVVQDLNWPRYRFTTKPRRLFEGWKEGESIFQAPNDDEAEQWYAHITVNVLRFIIPGEGTCEAMPRKLIEVATGRVVRDFEAEGIGGWEPKES
jgi:hypothetical protein